jgi:pyocin large subunit-like protein
MADGLRAAPARDNSAGFTANRSATSQERADQLFERNGADFGARDTRDFAAKARAFVTNPPAGVETIRRGNGDTLFYHAASNTFAVATRDGTPRTMFKPDNGEAYWLQQKEREAQRAG